MYVMTKEKLDKEIGGQTCTPHMLLKTHPPEKHKSIKFDKFKLLDSHTEWLAEIMDKINTWLQDRQNQQIRYYEPYCDTLEY